MNKRKYRAIFDPGVPRFVTVCVALAAGGNVLAQSIPDVGATGRALAANIQGNYNSVATPSSGGAINAPVAGNGDLALMVGGASKSLSFCIGKADFWGVERGAIMPVGSLLLSIPALSGSSYSLNQNIGPATITGKFTAGSSELTLTGWVATSENSAVIQLQNTGTQPLTVASELLDGYGTSGNAGTYGAAANSTWLNVSPDSVYLEMGNHLNIGSNAPFQGSIANLQVFNQALSGNALQGLESPGAPAAVLQWTATNTGSATLKGTASLNTSDPHGGSVVLTGDANSEVLLGAMCLPQAQFTVSTWIKLAAVNPTNDSCIFAGLVSYTKPNSYPFLRGLNFVVQSNGRLSAALNDSGGIGKTNASNPIFTNDAVNAYAVTSSFALPLNQWIQAAVAYDGYALNLYTNGTPLAVNNNFPNATNVLGWNKTAIHLGDTNTPFDGCAPRGVFMQSVLGATTTLKTNTLTFAVPAGGQATIVLAAVTDRNTTNYFAAAQQQAQQATTASLSTLLQQHDQWWSNFWSKSFIQIPDPLIQNNWYASLYLLACCSTSNAPPPGLFGNFAASRSMAWQGDYTLDYNYQAPFWAAYANNHPELADNYEQPLLENMPRGQAAAQRFGFQGLFFLTHLIPSPGWSDDGNTFWSQKSDAIFAAVDCAMRWRYTHDTNYAAKVYPYLKGVADFWDNYLVLSNNLYVDYSDAADESGSTSDSNTATTLAFIRLVYPALMEISQVLNVDTNLQPTWSDILTRLSPLPIVPATSISTLNALGTNYLIAGENVIRDTAAGTAFPTPMIKVYQDHVIRGSSAGMNSTQTIFPGWNIGLESDPTTLAAARSTIRLAAEWFDFNDCCTFYPSAANIGYDPNAILTNLDLLLTYYQYPNFMLSTSGGGTEDYAIVPCALSSMFLQSYQTNVHIFPDWPVNKNAAFGNLNACGGFLISSAITNGLISYVRVQSLAGQTLKLLNPWPPTTVQVASTLNPAKQFTGALLTYQTQVGEVITLTPVNPPLAVPSAPAWFVATAGNGLVNLNWTASTAATGYNLKRSTNSASGYIPMGLNLAATSFIDSSVSNNVVYYYEVSALDSLGESTNSLPVSAFPNMIPSQATVVFTNGTFADNSVLAKAGLAAFEAYGLSLGDDNSRITANSYIFSSDPNGNIEYDAGGSFGGFLAGGGTSGDAGFDAVLNHGQTGNGSGLLVLNNLHIGTAYNVLFLATDTRSASSGSQFSVTSGFNTSPAQRYAFAGGAPALGGYLLATFVATTTSQWFMVNNTNGCQLNAVLAAIANAPATFTSGIFASNSVLSLAGPPAQVLYGVDLGDTAAHTTANGYVFGAFPDTNCIYGGASPSSWTGFLAGGGTSGDTAFDAILNKAELGNSGALILSNLVVGASYNVLFLVVDTRVGMGTRSFSIIAGAATSPSQSYACEGGSPFLGGYILYSFMATNTTQIFTNTQPNGYQLNAVLVGKNPNGTYYLNVKNVGLNRTNIVINGVNGPAGGTCRILASTNLTAPLAQWPAVATNYFNSVGDLNYTNALNPAPRTMFYRLVSP